MGAWVGLEAAVKALVSPDMYADVLQGGCVSGVVGGLIYYRDTCDFYDAHELAIWDTVADFVADIGDGNVLQYLGGLKNPPQSSVEFKNAMTWIAVELVVDRLNNELEQEKGNVD
jgi:hypothetical protein